MGAHHRRFTRSGWNPRIVSRIRTIKPDLLRHEALQTLEQNNPGSSVILVFIGLLTACDRLGHFPWEPRQLKLDIFPFLSFDMGKTLALLRENSFILQYEVGGKLFGEIPTFTKHQRISGKEAYEPPRYPQGSNGEASEKQLGKREREVEVEREVGKGNGIRKGKGEVLEPAPLHLHPLNYARKLLEDIQFPLTKDNMRVVAESVEAEIRTGKTGAAAYEFILTGALAAKTEGWEINRFFFADAKYRVENRTNGKGHAKESVAERNKRAFDELERMERSNS
jgi:hypothetical protein